MSDSLTMQPTTTLKLKIQKGDWDLLVGHLRPPKDIEKNPHILKWWTPKHDQILIRHIKQKQWYWWSLVHEVTDELLAITPPEEIKQWQKKDPWCRQSADKLGGLNWFLLARAYHQGFARYIDQPPRRKICPMCGQQFSERDTAVEKLGLHQIDICGSCAHPSILAWEFGNKEATREEIILFLWDLTHVLRRIPPQGFGNRTGDLHPLSTQERISLLELLKRKPTVARVKELFGTWFDALVEAEILDGDSRRLSRGTQSRAVDGHLCLSVGERTIDNLLHSMGVPHEREPPYPEGSYRADFVVNGIYIEYLGLAGNPEYDRKTEMKQAIAISHNIKLLLLYPSDLNSLSFLENKLREGLSLPMRNSEREANKAEPLIDDRWRPTASDLRSTSPTPAMAANRSFAVTEGPSEAALQRARELDKHEADSLEDREVADQLLSDSIAEFVLAETKQLDTGYFSLWYPSAMRSREQLAWELCLEPRHLPTEDKPGEWLPRPQFSGFGTTIYTLSTLPAAFGRFSYHKPVPNVYAVEISDDPKFGPRITVDERLHMKCRRMRLTQQLTWEYNTFRLLATDWFEHVLPVYENANAGDLRFREVIELSREYALGKIEGHLLAAAGPVLKRELQQVRFSTDARVPALEVALELTNNRKFWYGLQTVSRLALALVCSGGAANGMARMDIRRAVIAEKVWQNAQLAEYLYATPR